MSNKNELDVAKIFLTYTAFQGDAAKTAVTLDMAIEDVKSLAVSEDWNSKLESLNKLSGDSKEVQVQLNRAVNYVQAHRVRSILDRVISQLSLSTGEELVDLLTVSGGEGRSAELKTRALTDLVKAIETAQLMTQRALGDTAAERVPEDDNKPGSAIALQVLRAMNAADQLGVDSAEVVRKQIAAENPLQK